MIQGSSGFLDQLKRRRVVRVVLMYAAASFVALQAAELLGEVFRLPPSFLTIVGALVVLGLPLVVALGWVFDFTPDGIRRTDADGIEPAPRWISAPVVLGLAGFLVAGMILGASRRGLPSQPSEAAATLRHLQIVLPEEARLAFVGAHPIGIGVTAFDISPDGALLVYVGEGGPGATQLYVRGLAADGVRPLAGTAGAYAPVVSPDSRQVAFVADDHVKVTSLDGGRPAPLAPAVNVVGLGWWGVDRILIADREGYRLRWVPASGGEASPVAVDPTTIGRSAPRATGRIEYVPEAGRAIHATGDRLVVATDPESGHQVELLRGQNPRVVGDRLFFTRGGDLLAIAFDRRRARVHGDAELIAAGLRTEAFGHAQYAAVEGGPLIFARGDRGMQGRLDWVTREGSLSRTPLPDLEFSYDFDLDPRGEALAVGLDRGPSELWMFDLRTGEGHRVRGADRHRSNPRWLDAERLLFHSRRASAEDWEHFVVRRDGSEEVPLYPADGSNAKRRPGPPRGVRINGVAPDGTLSGSLFSQSGDWDLGLFHPDGRWELLERPGSAEIFGIFSPDGRWLLHASDESGRYEIYVVSRENAPRTRLSYGGGDDPFWSPAGDEIFFRHGTRMMSARVRESDGHLLADRPRELFDDPAWINLPGLSGRIHPDGTRFLLARALRDPFADRLEVLEGAFSGS